MTKDYVLGEDELLEVKSDRLFHDLFNENEMNTIEWATMMILEKSYEEIHGNVTVGNIRLTNMSRDDKNKFVDLIVNIDNKKIIIELNNNYSGNYLRNTLYAINSINNTYIEGSEYGDKRVQGILINLNWISSKDRQNYSKKEIIYSYPEDGKEDDYLLKIININLAYYEKKSYNEFDGVDRLSKLLTVNSKVELKKISNQEKLLNNYYNKMDRLSHDKEYCSMIWDERIEKNLRKVEAYSLGKLEGKEEGREEGRIEREKEIVETISKRMNIQAADIEKMLASEETKK